MSQMQKIVAYMREHGSIDQRRAVADLGCYRLGARIYDLKAAGVPVRTTRRERLDERGRVVASWAEYSL